MRIVIVRKVCRFVRQHDLFYEYLTVEEHLYYQAILRIGDRPFDEIQNRLIWVIQRVSNDLDRKKFQPVQMLTGAARRCSCKRYFWR